jgi:hypothetical protein
MEAPDFETTRDLMASSLQHSVVSQFYIVFLFFLNLAVPFNLQYYMYS